jgi:hypothetical protein
VQRTCDVTVYDHNRNTHNTTTITHRRPRDEWLCGCIVHDSDRIPKHTRRVDNGLRSDGEGATRVRGVADSRAVDPPICAVGNGLDLHDTKGEEKK